MESKKHVKWIPFDIMVAFILPRLPVKSLARFRCVCKKWCSLTYNPHFGMEQLNKGPGTPLTLMVSHGEVIVEGKILLYDFVGISGNDEVEDHSYYFKQRDNEVYILSNSVNGLACAFCWKERDSECSYPYLLNPITRQALQLPGIRNVNRDFRIQGSMSLVLGFDDSTGVYKLVRSYNDYTSHCCYVEVLTLGVDQEWRRLAEEVPCYVFREESVFVHGAIHWAVTKLKQFHPLSSALLALDIKEENFQFISLPKVMSRYLNTFACLAMRKLEGCLCLVQMPSIPDPTTVLKIWKLKDYSKHEWRLDHSISISSWAAGGQFCGREVHVIDVIAGKLLIQRHGVIYSYDIDRGTLHTVPFKYCPRSLDVLRGSLISPSSLIHL